MPSPLRVFSAALVAALAVGLSGCAAGGASAEDVTGASSAAGPSVRIVASTGVYGDIAEAIGGDRVSVTSIIDDPNKDPHEYQANGQDALALAKASIVIENGGGYDDFIDTMLSSVQSSDATVLNVATLSGYNEQPADGGFNEHLWYDFPTVTTLVDELARTLTAQDPAGATVYQTNAADYDQKLQALEMTESQLKSQFAATNVAITEPVALYMLDAIGLVNKTPATFSEAVENDTDVAPDVLSQTLSLFSNHEVAILVYNSQTSGPQTEAVLTAAQNAGIAVVPVTESLPDGQTYLGWMTANLAALGSALTSASSAEPAAGTTAAPTASPAAAAPAAPSK